MACPGQSGPTPDAEVDADAGDGGSPAPEPELAAAPAPPSLTPCPAGWREVPGTDGTARFCDPWPEGGPDDCDSGEAHLLGAPGCAPIGPACPAGPWAEDLPGDREVVYVLAGAAPGGDGSAAAPFGTIDEGLDAVAEGGIVAVGRGTYEEAVELRDVALWGACPTETVVATTTTSGISGTVTVRGEGSVLRGVTVSGPRVGIYLAAATGSRLENVVVDGAAEVGIQVSFGSEVEASGLVVRDTASRRGAGSGGLALMVETGSRAVVRGGAFERNRYIQVLVSDEDTVAVLEDLAVRDSLCQEADGAGGGGVAVERGARLELRRVLLERTRFLAVSVYDEPTTLVLEDVLVRETLAQESGRPTYGRGLDVHDGTVEGSRVAILSSQDHGVWAGGPASVTLEDLLIRGTESRESDGLFGVGLEVAVGAHAVIRRAELSANRYAAISASQPGTVLELEDVRAVDTRAESASSEEAGLGTGLSVFAQATARLRRVSLERGHVEGMCVQSGAVVEAEDLSVRDTLSAELDGHFGRGVDVVDGARLEASRMSLSGNRDASIVVVGPEASVSVVDLAIDGTLPRACAEHGCPSGGIGVAALGGGAFEATRFRIADAVLAGLQVAHGAYRDEAGGYVQYETVGSMDLHEGVVRGCTIGANVQDAAFDLDRITDRVRYEGNGRDLDMDSIAVPDPGVDLGE